MKNIFLLMTCISSLSTDPSVELFMYWQSWAKGDELFVGESDGLLHRLGRHQAQKNQSIKSWELEKYRSSILSWKMVENATDFWHYLVPKKIEEIDSKWVFWSLGPVLKKMHLANVPKEKMVLFLWEPPTVEKEGYDPEVQKLFSKIYTWDDDLVDGKKFFKFYYPELREKQVQKVPFHEKKFCAMVATRLSSKHPKELYSERIKAIRFFEDKENLFDLYGRGWEKKKYVNWKGTIPDKIEVIKNYKFSLCYENMKDVRGYITEKIFDCFAAQNVPIYWGASNVTDYIPANCFIDRRNFNSNVELFSYLQSINDEEYNEYLDNIARFQKSEEAKLFSIDYFIETFQTVYQ
jgi:alpha(1,3/1,4) fucosyltransferase